MLNLINLLVSADVWWGLPQKLEFLKTIVQVIENVLWPILIVVATIGTIYAIYLGINMAKAEETGKRDEAKKHIIAVVTAMAITVVFILAINLIIIPNIPNWVAGVDAGKYAELVANTDGSDADYDTRSEVEGLLGTFFRYENGYYEYRVKVDGNNKTVWVKYGDGDAVTEITQNTPTNTPTV